MFSLCSLRAVRCAAVDAHNSSFDVDGDGSTDALTDGLPILRYLFGVRGTSLTHNAIGSGALRTTAAQIETYLRGLSP
jgi:hypothetical protein